MPIALFHLQARDHFDMAWQMFRQPHAARLIALVLREATRAGRRGDMRAGIMCRLIRSPWRTAIETTSPRRIHMFAFTRAALSAVAALTISSGAFATNAHRTHPHRPGIEEQRLPPKVYGSYAHCSPSKGSDFSRLQPGDVAIMIQDRGYRDSIGDPFDQGECW
jgi:hypothetical protein